MLLDKPLYTLLLVSLGLTVLSLLQPPADATVDTAAADLLADHAGHVPPPTPTTLRWQRPIYRLHESTTLTPVAKAVTMIPISAPPIITPVSPDAPAPVQPSTPTPGFRYLGRLTRDNRTWIFLEQGDNTYSVALGQVFEGTWRLDAVQADRLDLTYLPLKTAQSLPLRDE